MLLLLGVGPDKLGVEGGAITGVVEVVGEIDVGVVPSLLLRRQSKLKLANASRFSIPAWWECRRRCARELAVDVVVGEGTPHVGGACAVKAGDDADSCWGANGEEGLLLGEELKTLNLGVM